MTTETQSTTVQNTLAIPQIANPYQTKSTNAQLLRDTVTMPVSGIGDKVIMCPIATTAVIETIELVTEDLGTTGVLDFGLFRPHADGTFDAVASACIATGLDVTTPQAEALAPARLAALSTDSAVTPLWQIAGLSQPPNYPYFYLGLTVTTATTAAGKVSVSVLYTA